MRIDGNGGRYWLFFEYGTRNHRTGGGGAFQGEQYQTTPTPPFETGGLVHRWSLDYDPAANDGNGLVTFRVDNRTYRQPLPPGHRADGATFNRFGIWNQQTAGDHLELYVDDLVVDGGEEPFDVDPRWEGAGNQVEFVERVIRPYHDFGYTLSKHCGGEPGEIGGIIFRDERPAYYAAPTARLSLDDELRAQGKLAFLKAGSDSGVCFGWFDSSEKRSKETSEYQARQKSYLAVMIEGPSRVGHFFRPCYSTAGGAGHAADGEAPDGSLAWPVVRPDGQPHTWSMHYDPKGANDRGQIELTLDGRGHSMPLAEGHRREGASFDRFGLFNLQAGGHHVEVYLDDLQFSGRKE
jgi:hypothetical protein